MDKVHARTYRSIRAQTASVLEKAEADSASYSIRRRQYLRAELKLSATVQSFGIGLAEEAFSTLLNDPNW